jgi:DNA/RNA-binding domain of Phe-tRNA-synthetase-like protein
MITIDKQLKEQAPELCLGVVKAKVENNPHHPELWKEIDKACNRLIETYETSQVNQIPQIQATRQAYKKLGKDPSRYRGSAEALLRRILQKKGLYKVNTVVDINNLVSLESLLPVGTYDLSRLNPPITFRIGREGEKYKGIGKDEINLHQLPIFADELGPFGSPTSDSERSMIQVETKEILMVIISFADDVELASYTERAEELLARYAGGTEIEKRIIG